MNDEVRFSVMISKLIRVIMIGSAVNTLLDQSRFVMSRKISLCPSEVGVKENAF